MPESALQLTCPYCSFAKSVPLARLPQGGALVTCPKCGGRFRLPPATSSALQSVEAADRPDETETLPKAGFWLRCLAFGIDTLVLLGVQTVLGIAMAITIGIIAADNPTAILAMGWLAGMVSLAIGSAYYVFFTGYGGQTPGKMVAGIRVICGDGSEPGFGRAFFREVFGKFVSGILLGAGYLMIAIDRQKQGLHDKIADTFVIKV